MEFKDVTPTPEKVYTLTLSQREVRFLRNLVFEAMQHSIDPADVETVFGETFLRITQSYLEN